MIDEQSSASGHDYTSDHSAIGADEIVNRDSWNLYPLYPLFPCSDFVSQMWGWFGGGGCNVFLTCYAIYNISRKKKIWEYKYIFFF